MPAIRAANTSLSLPFFATCLAMASCVAVPASVSAANDTPEEVGLAIAEAARVRENGFGDLTARQVMLLRNRQGRESRRELRVQVLEMPDDGNRTLFVFDDPRDVRGTAFLVHARRADDDGQWLYLPALRRVKRISSSNRSGSFMETDQHFQPCGDFSANSAQVIDRDGFRGAGHRHGGPPPAAGGESRNWA